MPTLSDWDVVELGCGRGMLRGRTPEHSSVKNPHVPSCRWWSGGGGGPAGGSHVDSGNPAGGGGIGVVFELKC